MEQIPGQYCSVFANIIVVLVDAHWKWPEVIHMSSTTSSATIQELGKIFTTFGLPEQLVSDNGPQFVSAEFSQFWKSNIV